MPNVRLTTRETAVKVLTTVGSAAHTLSEATASLGYLAEAGSAHAKAYRDNAIAECTLASKKAEIIGATAATMKIARKQKEILAELNGDPELLSLFKAAYRDLTGKDFAEPDQDSEAQPNLQPVNSKTAA